MSRNVVPDLILGALVALLSGAARAVPPEQVKQLMDWTRDARSMWERLPAMAPSARKTAELIRDLEALEQMPANAIEGNTGSVQEHRKALISRLKMLLRMQYRQETGNGAIKEFLAPAEGFKRFSIPRNIHFIWLGSPLPEKYLANIQAIADLNPEYLLTLWLDDHSRASGDSAAVRRCRPRHVDEVLQLEATSETARSIYRLAVSTSGYKPNYAAASDVLRILVLLAEGGIYLDTDTGVQSGGAVAGFGQLQSKYGFLVSTQTRGRDGQFNNSPMAAVPGAPALRELLALAEKRYRDADHATQPALGSGPASRSWLHWVAAGAKDDLRLASTVYLCGPVLVADYLSRVGHGWLQAKNLQLEEGLQPGPPAVERFPGRTIRDAWYAPSSVAPVEDYFYIDNIYADFDLTSETFGLRHQFDHSWLPSDAQAAPAETKGSGPGDRPSRGDGPIGPQGGPQGGPQPGAGAAATEPQGTTDRVV